MSHAKKNSSMKHRTKREALSDDAARLKELEIHLGPKPPNGGDIRFHLVYPNHYWIAMSNLGFQTVYGLLAREPGVVVERGFLPKEEKQEPVRTFESNRLMADCDLLGFSLSFETDYPHLLKLLNNQKLLFESPEARMKSADESRFGQPLIIVGGTAVTLNPEPVADFLDLIFLGEAEEFLPELIATIRNAKSQGLGRRELLLELSRLEGVYVPAFFKPDYDTKGNIEQYVKQEDVVRPTRRFVKDISKFPAATKILTPETEFRSMYLTETGRGCEMGCRFCVAGYIYRPIRKRSEESIRESVKVGLESSSAVGFVGAAVSSHKAITKLTLEVANAGARASLSSLMAQRVTKELSASLTESEYKTVALAPEAGSERLRRAAGKRVSDDQFVKAAVDLAQAGIRGFKLYFMVGLPTETDEDVEAIISLSRRVREAIVEVSKPSGQVAHLILSVNPFIPKAATPFQWEPVQDRSVLEAKVRFLRSQVNRIPNVEMNNELPRESVFQALLSRGDRRVGQLLLEMEQKGKDWKWTLTHNDWNKGIPPIEYFVYRKIPFEEFLPWEVVDSRIEKQLLKREALRAYQDLKNGGDHLPEEFASDTLSPAQAVAI